MNRERLEKVRHAYEEYRKLKAMIAQCEEMRISPRSAVYGSERVQTSMRGDVQADSLARLDKLLKMYNERLLECAELLYEFETALEKLDELQRGILRHYYVDGMTWEQVCVEMKLSWTTLHRNRREAIEIIEKN